MVRASDGHEEILGEGDAAFLAVDDSLAFTIVVTVDKRVELGTSLENVAEVACDAEELYPSNNIDTADTSILGFCDHYYVYLPFIPRGPRPVPQPLPDLVGSFSLTPDKLNFATDEPVLITVMITVMRTKLPVTKQEVSPHDRAHSL